ncbi:MAG: Holliday junction resolvase RuvX [Exilibacterium sp.]
MTQTVIAFDYGIRSIGVAAGYCTGVPSTIEAVSELPSLKAKDGIPNWSQIQQLLREWKAQVAVVGLPLNMDGTESDLAARARKFGNRLHGRFGIQVEMMDERLSTFEAKQIAAERGHKGNYVNSPVDSIAARLILESWLRKPT